MSVKNFPSAPGTSSSGTNGIQSVLTPYISRFRYTPTIDVETTENEDEEEIYKIEVRGWKLSVAAFDAFNSAATSCTTITHMSLWNCGLNESHFNILNSTILTSNIRSVVLDMNPDIPDTHFALLIGEESLLKSLSIRSNGITDNGAKAISNALKKNASLASLNLWDNKVSRDGAEQIADVSYFVRQIQVDCSISRM